ncbi:hypothetical protein A1O1_05231 [Capronia coronata CBS 617.96]|uniref:RRM domain-containing protein n=1 Tax=Capronia coronata CBS 617.96 TaxID=1182541 RepID=W9YGB0_9EURO|nr:uncharacterized protein A1O1_05231 [Capronia coronata CBS 617.96]EXJ88301.1 hypothetical protein A1O1_05231 [Capronia coronata CBS 617.96]
MGANTDEAEAPEAVPRSQTVLVSKSSAIQSQRRWASTEGEKEAKSRVISETAPGAAEPANLTEATEEVLPAAETNEKLVAEGEDVTKDSAPGAAEPANLTEATDETLPASETNENLLPRSRSAHRDSAPAIAETANATEATEETLPAAEINESLAAASSPNQSASGAPAGWNGLFERKPTLYIGNLFFDVTETDLVKEFARFGTVTRCKIVRDTRGLSKGFGYVDFSTQEAADAALEALNMQLFEGRRITVQYAARSSGIMDTPAAPRRPMNPPSKTLFIGNMSFEMTDRDLSNLFRGIRNVIDVRVAIDRRTGQPRGFAHADFIDVKSAMEAAKVLSEKEIYGRKLRVDYSFSSSSRAPRNETSTGSDDVPPESQ